MTTIKLSQLRKIIKEEVKNQSLNEWGEKNDPNSSFNFSSLDTFEHYLKKIQRAAKNASDRKNELAPQFIENSNKGTLKQIVELAEKFEESLSYNYK